MVLDHYSWVPVVEVRLLDGLDWASIFASEGLHWVLVALRDSVAGFRRLVAPVWYLFQRLQSGQHFFLGFQLQFILVLLRQAKLN